MLAVLIAVIANALSTEILIKRLPPYADPLGSGLKDIVSHYTSLLSIEQFFGVTLSVAYATQNDRLLNYVRTDAKIFLEEEVADVCKSAAVLVTALACYISDLTKVGDERTERDVLIKRAIADMGFATNFELLAKNTPDFLLFSYAVGISRHCPEYTSYCRALLLDSGFVSDQLAMVSKLVGLLQGISLTLVIESTRTYEFGREANIG